MRYVLIGIAMSFILVHCQQHAKVCQTPKMAVVCGVADEKTFFLSSMGVRGIMPIIPLESGTLPAL
jgi:hypothetical protein